MWSDAETEWTVTPASKNGWLGLPPYPTWWAWYGEPYRSLVDGRLRVVRGHRTDAEPPVDQ